MKNFSLFNSENKKSSGAILIDIASGSVGAAISIFKDDEKPNIVFETREQFSIQSRLNRRKLLPEMVSALNKVIGNVSNKGMLNFYKAGRKLKLEKIVCQFSSPWHVSTTKSLHFKFEKAFSLTPHFVEDVLSYESKSFLASINKEEIGDGSKYNQKPVVAEQEVFATLVNGYPIKYPIDKEAKEFEMVIFLSAFPREVIDSTEKSVSKYFPGIEPDFHSTTIVYFNVFKKLFPNDDSFMVIHVSGETTDVSVIKKDAVTETISFPLGRNFIVRRLMSEIKGITPQIALSMMRVHAGGDILPKVSDKLKEILSQAESDWTELFADSMKDFSNNFFLPTKMFVIAGDDSAPVFAELISRRQLEVRGPGTPIVSAKAVDIAMFDQFVDSHQSESRDPFLAGAAFFSKERYFKN